MHASSYGLSQVFCASSMRRGAQLLQVLYKQLDVAGETFKDLPSTEAYVTSTALFPRPPCLSDERMTELAARVSEQKCYYRDHRRGLNPRLSPSS